MSSSLARLAGAGLALTLVGLYAGLATPHSWPYDEAWYMQVMRRMLSGDVLYRDMFFGIGPLSAYVGAGVLAITGVEIVGVKALTAMIFAIEVLLAFAIARRLAVSTTGRMVLVAGLLLYATPIDEAPYSRLAIMLLLLAMVIALRLTETPDGTARRRLLLAAGAVAGLALTAKQNIGVLALAALFIALAAQLRARPRELVRNAIVITGAALLVVAAALLPILISGGMPGLIQYGFLNKGAYVSYWAANEHTFADLFQFVGRAATPAGIAELFNFSLLALPPAALVLMVVAWARDKDRERWIVVAAFVGTGLLALFPVDDLGHIRYVAPLLLIGITYGGSTTGRRVRAPLLVVAGNWLAAGLVVVMIGPLLQLYRGELAPLSLPGYHGDLMAQGAQGEIGDRAGLVRKAAARGDVLLIGPDASFYYVLSQTHNPTPNDMPAFNTFGPTGEQDAIDAIAAGRIRQVCVDDNLFPNTAENLVLYVQLNMRRIDNFGFCVLYRRRA